jgi:hypothetical protein
MIKARNYLKRQQGTTPKIELDDLVVKRTFESNVGWNLITSVLPVKD